MKRTAFLLLLGVVGLMVWPQAAVAQEGGFFWAKQFGEQTLTGGESGEAVAVDSLGYVYLTGQFNDKIDFGGGLLPRSEMSDVFLVKLTHDGQHVWSQSFQGTGRDSGVDIVIDSQDNIYLTATFDNTVNFGGEDMTSAGSNDFVLAKYDSDGNHIWSEQIGNVYFDRDLWVDVDVQDNVYVAGYISGRFDFGGGELPHFGSEDIFFAKYDPQGRHIWSRQFGGRDSEYALAMTVTGNYLYLTGSFEGRSDFGGEEFVSGALNTFTTKYDLNGNHIWSNRYGQTRGESIAVDEQGDVYVAGCSIGNRYPNCDYTFLVKYDETGEYVWSKRFFNSASGFNKTVKLDQRGDVHLIGSTYDAVEPDDSAAKEDQRGLYWVKYSRNGNLLNLRYFITASANDIVFDHQGGIYMTGLFFDTLSLGDEVLTTRGSYDMFLIYFGNNWVSTPLPEHYYLPLVK